MTSDQKSLDHFFYQILHGAFWGRILISYSNGSALLNKLAKMLIYGKNSEKSSFPNLQGGDQVSGVTDIGIKRG